MPTVTVSEDYMKYIEKLHDMPLVNNKVPNVKKTIELILEFVEEKKSGFIQWTEEKGQRVEFLSRRRALKKSDVRMM